jgi:hypothetical protein
LLPPSSLSWCPVVFCCARPSPLLSLPLPNPKSHHYYHLRNTSNTVSTTSIIRLYPAPVVLGTWLPTTPYLSASSSAPAVRSPQSSPRANHPDLHFYCPTYTRQSHYYDTSQSPVSDPYTTAPLQLCRPETLRPRHHVLSHQPPWQYTAGDSS